jgi:hypothetical protein
MQVNRWKPVHRSTVKTSRDERLPILLTSAIRVAAPFTKLSDTPERMAATIRALSYWMTMCRDAEFVLCDGSGFDLSRELAAAPSIDIQRVEVITFENDRDEVKTKGKGYGEGQITKYALEHSSILNSAKSFAKCTGKLWVDNFWSCRRAYNGTAGFTFFGFRSVVAVDTRFFIVRKDFFEENLLESYVGCDDSRGKFLENVYLDSLDTVDRKRWMLTVFPQIRGISGTSGKEYRSSRLKQLGKTLAVRVLRRCKPPNAD